MIGSMVIDAWVLQFFVVVVNKTFQVILPNLDEGI